MPKFFRAPAGTHDFLPDDHDFFTFIKKVVRHRFRQAGFRRISPPNFEETAVFEKSLGAESEIFQKKLFSFSDRTGKNFSLRPEITTGIVRAFIEKKMDTGALPKKFYYIGKCFQFERPRVNVQREFWQFGTEILGEFDPAIDAKIIYLGHRILQDLGIREKCSLKINFIGDRDSRRDFFEALENFFAGKERNLTPASREKIAQKKFFEFLAHPQSDDEKILIRMAPKILDFLNENSKNFFDEMLEYLKIFEINFEICPNFFLSKKYYSNTIFEFSEKKLEQKILSGGRYDELIEKMGGESHGAIGFAAGVERIINLMKKNKIEVPQKDFLQIFVAATGPIAKKHALPILIKLREHGFHAVGVLGKASMQTQLERAQKFKVPFIILIGDIEVKKNQVIVRDNRTGKQIWLPTENLLPEMEKLLNVKLDSTVDFLGHE